MYRNFEVTSRKFVDNVLNNEYQYFKNVAVAFSRGFNENNAGSFSCVS